LFLYSFAPAQVAGAAEISKLFQPLVALVFLSDIAVVYLVILHTEKQLVQQFYTNSQK